MMASTSFAQNLVNNGGFEAGNVAVRDGGMVGWNPVNDPLTTHPFQHIPR